MASPPGELDTGSHCWQEEIGQIASLNSGDASVASELSQEHISSNTDSSEPRDKSLANKGSEETAHGSLLSFDAVRELRLLDPNVGTREIITVRDSGSKSGRHNPQVSSWSPPPMNDDGMPSSNPISSPQEDGPWIDWQTAQTTIVEVVDGDMALPTKDRTSEDLEGHVQYSSYFEQRDREVASSMADNDGYERGIPPGHMEDPCSSPPSSSPPKLFTSSPMGSDDSVDELDEEPELNLGKATREDMTMETQEVEMYSLRPNEIPDEAYNETYEDNDMEQDELEDEGANSESYGESMENVGPEATGIRGGAQIAFDLRKDAKLVTDTEDPDASLVEHKVDEMEEDELEDEEDMIEDITDTKRQSGTMSNVEGEEMTLLDEPDPQPEAQADHERTESPEIEDIDPAHTKAEEGEHRLETESTPLLADIGGQPEHAIAYSEEEPRNMKQESSSEAASPSPNIDIPEGIDPDLGKQEVATASRVSSPASSPIFTEEAAGKIDDGLADETRQQGEFLSPDLQDHLEGSTRRVASLLGYEQPPAVNIGARDLRHAHLFHLEQSDDAWAEANNNNNDNGEKEVKPIPPPNPKRQTLASQKRQHKKLIKPFRSPFVGKPIQVAPSPVPKKVEMRKPEPRPMERVKDKVEVAPKTMVKHRTVRAAVQFKSPLSSKTSSQVIPSIRMTPTIQMLERRVQILRRAVKIQEEDEEGNLEIVAKKWREAAREVAWEVWEVVKDRVAEAKESPWGKFEEDKGKKRSFNESWGWADQGEVKALRLEDDGGNPERSELEDMDVEFKLTKGIPEEEEHRDTLGTMLRQLGIAPETLGWNEEQGTFEDD
ncbi:hypothetical protein PLEOSDRAFT_1112091 [Pleurotus ostreatus PC15]|uniref:Uncharacterized protein n=1 Tax=Pleurotus ostreatus (strain PC15) TaxID=1137138 RepID=A0A067NZN5_PLEO1|nr:hypothetical protein PLEOSDRAFT_1112091 [Pleurotus ostreatus PC15]